MAQSADAVLSTGEHVRGFDVRNVTAMEGRSGVAYELEHRRSGARLLCLHTDDPENLFSVSFVTPPPDDTGLPHILEHAVLGGSRQYPVRDPFFEMVKMSMATFINAMTAPDFTCYPVASNVKQDLLNLSEVYFDAVFHPLVTREIFEREGHHLAVRETEGGTRELTVTGIVFNEMKGAASQAETRLDRCAEENLFGRTTYGLWSGGDPRRIPELTYEDFLAFHQRLYHPSNAFFFLYGDIPPAEHLERLDQKLSSFTRQDGRVEITRTERWQEPRAVTDTYPIGADEDPAHKTFLQLHWLMGDASDPRHVMAMELLSRILLGHEAAPLRKALVDSGLGQDLTGSGFVENGVEGVFLVGLKGSEADQADAFRDLVMDTLAAQAAEAMKPEHVEAAFQQSAYEHREIGGSYPVRLMFQVMQSWIYGGDPLAFVTMDKAWTWCREQYEADPNWFNQLITRWLIENPHRLMVTLAPDRTLQGREEAAFAEKMRERQAEMSDEDLDAVAGHAEALNRLSGTPNSPEALALLPQLGVKDLPAGPRHIDTTVQDLGSGMVLLRNDVFSNKVNYLHLDFDLRGLPTHLWPYLSLYLVAMQKLGAAGMDYEAIARRVAGATGGIGCHAYFLTHAEDPERPVWGVRLALKTLDEQIEPALKLLEDLFFLLDPRDHRRLADVIKQSRAHYRTALPDHGQQTPALHASRGFDPQKFLAHQNDGLPQLRLLEDAHKHYDRSATDLMARIEAIRDFFAMRCRMTASFTGSDQAAGRVEAMMKSWRARMRDGVIEDLPTGWVPFDGPCREGLAAPIQVAHCARVCPAPHASHPDARLLAVGAHLVSFDYMISEIRFKGNAYGAWCRYDGLGSLLHLGSFSDPHVERTLDVMSGLPAFLKSADWSQQDIDRAIIGCARGDERPVRPEEATAMALHRHRVGISRELRERRYAQMLAARPAEVRRAMLDLLENGFDRSSICVLANREKLAAANDRMPGAPLAIEDLLT